MNFQSIRYFLQVEKRRSFSQAAADLYISQQTLSASIASLEKELGSQLFVRHVPLELTYAGEQFLQYAKGFQQNLEYMERDFAEIGSGRRGRLRVGITTNRGQILMPRIVRAFHEKHPKVCVEIMEERNDNLIEAIGESEIDLAIASFPERIRGISLKELFLEEIVLVLSDALLQSLFGEQKEAVLREFRKSQELRLLAEVPFLFSSVRSASGRSTRDLFRKTGIVPRVAASSGDMVTLIEMCFLGEGACFCPLSLLRALLPTDRKSSMTILHLSDPGVKYSIQIGWKTDEKDWSIRRDFIRAAKEAQVL